MTERGVLPDYSKHRADPNLSSRRTHHHASRGLKDYSQKDGVHHQATASPRGTTELDMDRFLVRTNKSAITSRRASIGAGGVDWNALTETLDKPSQKHKLAMDDESAHKAASTRPNCSSRLSASLTKSLSCHALGLQQQQRDHQQQLQAPNSRQRLAGTAYPDTDQQSTEEGKERVPQQQGQRTVPTRTRSHDMPVGHHRRRPRRGLPEEAAGNTETTNNLSNNGHCPSRFTVPSRSRSDDGCHLVVRSRSFRHGNNKRLSLQQDDERLATLLDAAAL